MWHCVLLFWLIPFSGRGLKLLNAVFKLLILLLISAKVANFFLLHQNLSYSMHKKYFMRLFGTPPPIKKCPGVYPYHCLSE